MRPILEDCTLIIILCLFANGCASSTSQAVKPDPSAQPTSPVFAGKPTSSKGKYTRVEGWPVPVPEQKKMTRRSTARIGLQSGDVVRASVKEYAPVGDFIFVQEFPSSISEDLFETKRLKLKLITEYSVKGSIFLYSVAAIGLTENDKATGPVLVFALKDEDGDGRFEALLTANEEIVVPFWAAQ